MSHGIGGPWCIEVIVSENEQDDQEQTEQVGPYDIEIVRQDDHIEVHFIIRMRQEPATLLVKALGEAVLQLTIASKGPIIRPS